MRLFIGIGIPEELCSKITKLQEKLKDFDIKLVERENLHFCIRFLGNVEEQRLPLIRQALEEACAGFKPFTIKIHGLGCFPSQNYIRVIWLGIKDGYYDMVSLTNNINKCLDEYGFPKEDEKFIPHLTLGRVRTSKDKIGLKKLLEELKDIEIGYMEIKEVKIFGSELTRQGPKYTIHHIVKLM